MDTKNFSLRTILTATTGILLTKSKGERDNGIGDLHELFGWMTDDQPFTHQLGRFGEECKPWLYRWFPELEGCETETRLKYLDRHIEAAGSKPDVGIDIWVTFLKTVIPTLKDSYDVPRIPRDDHTFKDPVEELREMAPHAKIIVAKTPE
jgi:hypothetical protein